MNTNNKKKKTQEETNKRFLEVIKAQYKIAVPPESQCIDDFIRWMIQHNFIRQRIINRFMVLHCYPLELEKTKSPDRPRGVKRQAIWNLEEDMPLCESSINNIIKHYSNFFKKNKLQFP